MAEKVIHYYGIKPTSVISDVYPNGKFNYGQTINTIILSQNGGGGYVENNVLMLPGAFYANNTLYTTNYVENHILYI